MYKNCNNYIIFVKKNKLIKYSRKKHKYSNNEKSSCEFNKF